MIYKYEKYKCDDCGVYDVPIRDDCNCRDCVLLPIGHPDRDITFRCNGCGSLNIDWKVIPPKDVNGQPDRSLYDVY